MICGCDISTYALTLCALGDNVVAWETATLRERRTNARLWAAVVACPSALSLALARLNLPVEEVYIERGWGESRRADFDLGAIYGAAAVAFSVVRPGIHVAPMKAPDWKQVVTAQVGMTTAKGLPGIATANKATANSACNQILMLEYGIVRDLTPDELDAFGIAWAARNPSVGDRGDPTPRARPERL